MDAQPAVFSGTLKVRVCHAFWTKTPVQLIYHREDFRQALPVLLVRRPNLLGGEFRVPLDPCIHPVRLLPMTTRMTCKMEFALEYGWQTKQVRMRAPDANMYRQWMSLVRTALESGRRPLASCDSIAATDRPRQDMECASLASTLNSSQATFNATVRQRILEEAEREEEEDDEDTGSHLDRGLQWQSPSEFFVLHYNFSLSSSAVDGSCSCERPRPATHPAQEDRRFWPTRRIVHVDYATMIHELFLQTRFLFFL